MTNLPRIVDDDHGKITVVLYGRELAAWLYVTEEDRTQRRYYARTYIEGWLARDNLEED